MFAAVAHDDRRGKNEFAAAVMNIDSDTVHSNSDEDRSTHSAHSAMNLEKEGLFARHVGALLWKRASNFKRDALHFDSPKPVCFVWIPYCHI